MLSGEETREPSADTLGCFEKYELAQVAFLRIASDEFDIGSMAFEKWINNPAASANILVFHEDSLSLRFPRPSAPVIVQGWAVDSFFHWL
jgi:hypothetical protein